MTSFLILLLVLLFLCLSSGFFSASETALFSLSSLKVKTYERDLDQRKRMIANLLRNPQQLLVTILILNVTVNIFVQNIASHLFGDFSGWALKVGVPLLLTLLIGEIIPKSLALQNNTKIAYRVAPVIHALRTFLGPIRIAVTYVTTHVYRSLFFFLRSERDISHEELQHALQQSEEQGILTNAEAKLMHGYLNLQNVTVKELMRPREEVLFFDLSQETEELLHRFVDQECSRLPICEGGLDKVLGILNARQYFLFKEHLYDTDDMKSILRKPLFVPETTPARVLLQKLSSTEEETALVVDEYGSVSGLITLEDLMEVVVGKIADRRDEKSRYTRAGENVIIASGKMEMADFEKIFPHAKLPNPHNMVTLGGWLTSHLGDIPDSGTKHKAYGFLFHVLAAEPKRVRRLYIRHLKEPSVGGSHGR